MKRSLKRIDGDTLKLLILLQIKYVFLQKKSRKGLTKQIELYKIKLQTIKTHKKQSRRLIDGSITDNQ